MRSLLFITLMLTLWVVADTAMAHAQDLTTESPRVRHEINDWLDDAAAFRTGVQDTARLWQRDAPLLAVRTDIFADEAQNFADATEDCATRIRRLSPSSDAAAMLFDVARDLDDRLSAIREAQDAANVTHVLGGMDQVVAQVLASFGDGAAAQARMQGPEVVAPIRASYVTEPSRTTANTGNRVASSR